MSLLRCKNIRELSIGWELSWPGQNVDKNGAGGEQRGIPYLEIPFNIAISLVSIESTRLSAARGKKWF